MKSSKLFIVRPLGGSSYAYGGAETGTGESNIGNHALNMLDQVDVYLANHTPNGSEQFLVWGGVNDVISAYFISPTEPNLSQSVANLSQLITSLVDVGGADFMVLNMFPLDVTPFGLSLSLSLRVNISQDVSDFNQLLAEEVDRLKLERGLSIEYVDVHSRFLERMVDPEAFGFTNITEPAWDEDTGEIVSNPEEYMFWDIVHPTTKTHELLATIPDPADFDDDGDVDGFDFLKWQRGESPIPLSQSDLADCRANFGNPSLAATAGIPEPSTLLLGAMAVVGLLMRRTNSTDNRSLYCLRSMPR